MSINFQELRELLSAIAQTDIAELTLKSDEFELMVRKGTSITPTPTTIVTPGVTEVVPPPSPPKSVVLPNSPPETSSTPAIDKKWVEITSPMVGTFYRAPAPEEPPFVDTGERISKGQTVCIIEAMKLMNEIEAEISGQVMEILVQNGEPVEYGQTLMWVNPD
ncbi:acetyl-CoA carboxylase, biotin carboxyl carrier protein [Stanieria sp. NIES-3757]|nr:acetyl-CoA carboxylase, biotin carboxyl carrier protein [Stanieria sp. NIES-3757]